MVQARDPCAWLIGRKKEGVPFLDSLAPTLSELARLQLERVGSMSFAHGTLPINDSSRRSVALHGEFSRSASSP
jgi:hypothetical protein